MSRSFYRRSTSSDGKSPHLGEDRVYGIWIHTRWCVRHSRRRRYSWSSSARERQGWSLFRGHGRKCCVCRTEAPVRCAVYQKHFRSDSGVSDVGIGQQLRRLREECNQQLRGHRSLNGVFDEHKLQEHPFCRGFRGDHAGGVRFGVRVSWQIDGSHTSSISMRRENRPASV